MALLYSVLIHKEKMQKILMLFIQVHIRFTLFHLFSRAIGDVELTLISDGTLLAFFMM